MDDMTALPLGPRPYFPDIFEGSSYADNDMPQKQFGRTMLRALRLQGDERAIDIGCGDGELSAFLANQLPQGHVLGIDLSASMIEHAKSKKISNAEFRVANASELSNDIGPFDVIFSNASVHWISDRNNLFLWCRRNLASGGQIRMNFGAKGNNRYFSQAVSSVMARDAYVSPFHDFTWPWYFDSLEYYCRLFGDLGLEITALRNQNVHHKFQASQHHSWIRNAAIRAFLSPLNAREQKMFIGDVLIEFERVSIESEGIICEHFSRIDLNMRQGNVGLTS